MRYCFLGRTVLSVVVAVVGGCGNGGVKQQDDAELLRLKSKCREDGQKVRAEWIRTYYKDVWSDEPEYGYSQSLHTCLWIDNYRGPSIDWKPAVGNNPPKLIPVQTHVRFILDVYTNKMLIEYTEHNGKQIGDVSEAAFKRRKDELLSAR